MERDKTEAMRQVVREMFVKAGFDYPIGSEIRIKIPESQNTFVAEVADYGFWPLDSNTPVLLARNTNPIGNEPETAIIPLANACDFLEINACKQDTELPN